MDKGIRNFTDAQAKAMSKTAHSLILGLKKGKVAKRGAKEKKGRLTDKDVKRAKENIGGPMVDSEARKMRIAQLRKIVKGSGRISDSDINRAKKKLSY